MEKENKITCGVFILIVIIIVAAVICWCQKKYEYFDKGTYYKAGIIPKDYIAINDLSSRENAHKVLDELWNMKEQLEKK